MIASIRGILQSKALDHVVLDVHGVGYQVLVSTQTLTELPTEQHEVFLLCHTHVREEALTLFGFLEAVEREAFHLLIGVSGVGPKLALTVLSGLPVGQLVTAIADGDHRRLQAVPGVGKKTAERLVLELKDKMGRLRVATAAPASAVAAGTGQAEVVEALTNLGYKRQAAERAVEHVLGRDAALPPEQVLRQALVAIAEL